MYSEHGMVSHGGIGVGLVVGSYELVVVLSPGEYGAPVRQRVRQYRQPVAPRLHYCFHVVKRWLSVVNEALQYVKEVNNIYIKKSFCGKNTI